MVSLPSGLSTGSPSISPAAAAATNSFHHSGSSGYSSGHKRSVELLKDDTLKACLTNLRLFQAAFRDVIGSTHRIHTFQTSAVQRQAAAYALPWVGTNAAWGCMLALQPHRAGALWRTVHSLLRGGGQGFSARDHQVLYHRWLT
jgi:hypothetical protein